MSKELFSALAQEKLAKAKSAIILGDPFFASLMFKLKFKQDSSCETLWTDGVSLGFNPEYIEILSIDQVKGAIVHEIMHCVSKHPMRRGDRQHSLWNLACDYAINSLIIQTGNYALPDGVATDLMFDGKSAEAIYNALKQAQDQNKDNSQGEGSGQGGQGEGPDTGEGNGENPSDKQDENPDSQDNPENNPENNPEDSKENKQLADPGKCGEVRDYPEKKEGDEDTKAAGSQSTQEAMADWDIATVQASEAAKACGQSLGEGIQRFIDDVKDPKQPWKEVLARFMEEVSYNDYDWEVVNRQYLGNNIVLPSLHSKTFGDIAIAVDVSGSISDTDVKQMLNEIFGILKMFEETGSGDKKIPIIYCSSRVEFHEEISIDDEPHPSGSGGTRFSPAIKYAMDNYPDIKALIYLTDGYCNDFGPEPDFDLLWGICFDGIYKFEPPFGEVLYMEDNE